MLYPVYLNGNIIPGADANLSIYDHGYLYGDGVFEGIRAYNGHVFRLDDHVRRLYRSAHALGFDLPIPQAEFRAAVVNTVRASGLQSCYIRVTVSRGTGVGLDPRQIDLNPTIVISVQQLSLYPQDMYDNGLEVITASTRATPAVCIDPQIKSLGRYINNILAKMEANRMGAGEAIMLNMAGNVAEATGDNYFIVRDGELITPPTSEGALIGITRQTVMELAAKLGIPVRERVVTLYDSYNADEAFLTGTAAEVIPAVKHDNRTIGTGKPGPITRRIIDAFREFAASEGAPVYD